MITVAFISILLLALKLLKLYKKSSIYLALINEHSKKLFKHLHYSDTETIKKYLRYGLILLAVDYIISSNILHKYFGQDMSSQLLVGALFFITAFYFVIPQHTFEEVNQRMNKMAGKLLMPVLVFGTGAYIIPSIKPSDLVDYRYNGFSEQTKLGMLKVIFALFFILASVCVILVILSLSFKYFISINYYVSNLTSNGIKKFSGHCIDIHPEEPHEVLETWSQFIVMVLSGIITLFILISSFS